MGKKGWVGYPGEPSNAGPPWLGGVPPRSGILTAGGGGSRIMRPPSGKRTLMPASGRNGSTGSDEISGRAETSATGPTTAFGNGVSESAVSRYVSVGSFGPAEDTSGLTFGPPVPATEDPALVGGVVPTDEGEAD